MNREHHDVWVCPTCVKTFGVTTPRAFMSRDLDGNLECPECHKADFIEFERWSPLLTFHEDEGWLDEADGNMPWACDTAMFRYWPDLERAVENGNFHELYIVGRVAGPIEKPIPQDHREAIRDPGDSWGWVKGRDADVPYRCVQYADWLDGFGKDVTRVWIRLEMEHYS